MEAKVHERAAGLAVQPLWAARPLAERLAVIRRAREWMAARSEAFAEAISPTLVRSKADTLVCELLPLLEACRFLERNAAKLLRPRRLGRSGRPLWLGGVSAEIHREPLGHVLVIGPSNFPLFLPGVQALQAIAAGNAVTWKPGAGGAAVAHLVYDALREAGMPKTLLTITDESVEAAQAALAERPDKVVFTGSAENGHVVLRHLAHTATPAVVELSGADAIVVMPGAELGLVAQAVAFGLRLNGGAVCMSPRRLFATEETLRALRPVLEAELAGVPAVRLPERTASKLHALITAAEATGGRLLGEFSPSVQRPLLVDNATPAMAITASDVFAPVLSLLPVQSMLHVAEAYAACPMGLTAAIFCARGHEAEARALAGTLRAGTVLINDIIAPTTEPRVPFGGRGASGYGVTRGGEGLLEMTAVKVLLVRSGGATSMRHFELTRNEDAAMFGGMIEAVHGHGLAQRWGAVRAMINAARERNARNEGRG